MTNNGISFRTLFRLIDSAKLVTGSDIQIETKTIAVRDHFEEYFTLKVYKFGGVAYNRDFESISELYVFLIGYEACGCVANIKKAEDL